MKKIGPFLLGYIILLMADQAHGLIYNPQLYDTPVPLGMGEGLFIGETLSQVPEPGVLLLLGAGLIALVILGIRRRKRTAKKGKSIP